MNAPSPHGMSHRPPCGTHPPRMQVPPDLVAQLAAGGRMIVPVGPADGDQHLVQVDKDASGRVTVTTLGGVRFVPLTTPEAQLATAAAME